MSVEIVLVRHAETEGNAAGLWQGKANSDLSSMGLDQVTRLRKWFAGERFDRVVVSPLGRTQETARGVVGDNFETDERWREPSVGEWEGLSHKEIADRFPEKYGALLGREDVLLDDEWLSDVAVRTNEAFTDLVNTASDGDRILVVSHGLALMMFTSRAMGNPRSGSIHLQTNTGVTRIRVDNKKVEFVSYNDTSHLDPVVRRPRPDETQIILVRHGETVSNLTGEWEGQQEGLLSPRGHDQARLLGDMGLPVGAVYTSPLKRARDTGSQIAGRLAQDLIPIRDVQEMHFGEWEGMLPIDIAKQFPDDWAAIRDLDEDRPRGRTGETFSIVQKRVTTAIDSLASRHTGDTVAVVSHGGASRAFVLGILGFDYPDRRRLSILGNTAFARVLYTPRGTQLASWNSAPHLR
ncbi:MAG: histidine phosphatase family protein [Actinobacteria bacterium]|nr:histidine phosphatase family protein [Actinomycetota bacterium]